MRSRIGKRVGKIAVGMKVKFEMGKGKGMLVENKGKGRPKKKILVSINESSMESDAGHGM